MKSTPSPLTKRLFFAYGWVLVLLAAFCFSWLLTGCGEVESYAADQASLADAIAQAAKEPHELRP
jgi:hypothetical protein